MRHKDLQEALELVPEFASPKPEWEQYRTPALIAAKFLAEANHDGDIQNKDVLDLGCGTGMLAKGAVLLGAKTVTGQDIDAQAIALAKLTAPGATFVVGDIQVHDADTVVMNPPFGAQHKNADRPFLEVAWESIRPGGACWFLQMPQNRKFLRSWCKAKGTTLEEVARWEYPLEAKHWFHQDAVRKVEVAAFVFRKPQTP